MLTKEEMRTYRRPPKRIEVPELGEVYIRLVTEEEAVEIGDDVGKTSRAKFVSRCLCDADGQRIFADDELDMVIKLPFCATLAIFNEGMEFNNPPRMETGKN